MRVRVEYHPKTAAELNSAVARYNDLRQGLGDGLRFEVFRLLNEEVVRVLAIRHHRRPWISHGDRVLAAPPGCGVTAGTESVPITAFEDPGKGLYAILVPPRGVAHRGGE